MAVITALMFSEMTFCASAAEYSTKANSPPCAISTARSVASALLLPAKRATA